MNQLDRRHTPTEKSAKDRNKLPVSIMFNFTVNQQNTKEKKIHKKTQTWQVKNMITSNINESRESNTLVG